MININNKSWEDLTLEDVLQCIKEDYSDESFFFEFKSDEESNNGIVKEICAFSNTYGGYLFIGIKDNKEFEGCPSWTEEQINNIVYNSISPTPIFDIKRFISIDSKQLFIIKIEEGIDPPYISKNKGIIYQRVSSSSAPMKDAFVLTNLYNKKANNIEKLKDKIGINLLSYEFFSGNLCAILDVGFSFVSRNINIMTDKFFKANLEEISQMIKTQFTSYGITKLGNSYIFNIFDDYYSVSHTHVPADMCNFIEIMFDGSVRYRIMLASNDKNMVEVKKILSFSELYEKIYLKIFDEELRKQFISVYRYEHLHVYKQFKPIYNMNKEYLLNHQKKYGNNSIVTSSRFPKTGYNIIDKRNFENKEFNSNNIAKELINSVYSSLGYIDSPL